jgi:hypothetical protein
VRTWWRSLRRGQLSLAQPLNDLQETHNHKIQEKSKVGQVKSQYRPTKEKAQESLSKNPRRSNKWRVCYKCREKGHFADSCSSATMGSGTDRDRSDRCWPELPTSKNTRSPRTRLSSKHGQENTRSGLTNKNKSRICHECRQKGHMGKDCPNGNIPKSNLAHYDFHNIRNDKNGTCAMREISSLQCSMRSIWVPKHLVANPIGPNKCWVPGNACWACRLKEMHWTHG